MAATRKDAYIAARDIRDKERAAIREAEKLRRIHLNLTLEESDSEDDSFDVETPTVTSKKGKNYLLSPVPSSMSAPTIFVIYMATSYEHHFAQLRVGVYQNFLTKRKERKTMTRCPITYDDATEKHTLAHRNTKLLIQAL
jgi:hypothetical protein